MVMLDFIYMGSADLFGTAERGGSEKFKMKIYVSSGILTPVHDRKVSALDRSATLVRYQVEHL